MLWLRSAPHCVEPYTPLLSASKMDSRTRLNAAWIFAATRAPRWPARYLRTDSGGLRVIDGHVGEHDLRGMRAASPITERPVATFHARATSCGVVV